MQKNLIAAQNHLDKCLKGLLCSKDVLLPERAGLSLQQRFKTIARDHKVSCEVKESADSEASSINHCTLKIEGAEDLVKEAKAEIQDVIIEFQASCDQLPKVTPENFPLEWESQESEQCKLFHVTGLTEFDRIRRRVESSLPNAQITKLQRVQNKWLWARYLQEKTRLHEKNAGKVNELELFHGSRSTCAETICASEVGFDMRYSREGMWGQANYFAVKAEYSDTYAYRDDQSGLKELILAKVLAGDSYECLPDKSLKFPPEKPAAGDSQLKQVRYDSVSGTTHGSKVYMTYSNEKAYPAYIITYTIDTSLASITGRPTWVRRPQPSQPAQISRQTQPAKIPQQTVPPQPVKIPRHTVPPSHQQPSSGYSSHQQSASNQKTDSCLIL